MSFVGPVVHLYRGRRRKGGGRVAKLGYGSHTIGFTHYIRFTHIGFTHYIRFTHIGFTHCMVHTTAVSYSSPHHHHTTSGIITCLPK